MGNGKKYINDLLFISVYVLYFDKPKGKGDKMKTLTRLAFIALIAGASLQASVADCQVSIKLHADAPRMVYNNYFNKGITPDKKSLSTAIMDAMQLSADCENVIPAENQKIVNEKLEALVGLQKKLNY